MDRAWRAVVVSYRLGGLDGVSVEAAKWIEALGRLGWRVSTVAGVAPADHVISGLAIDAVRPPDPAALDGALAGADVVIVENLCSLPLNPLAGATVVRACRGRATVFHHHDLPWQQERYRHAHHDVADDPAWRHVTINDLSRHQLAERGIAAVTIRNAFDAGAPAGDRATTRAKLRLGPADRLVMQPTRAIARKNIPVALALARGLQATYWLLGPAEEDYDDELAQLLAGARVTGTPCIHAAAAQVADAYAAADIVAFPSSWEGFGNPVVESALYRRPLAIGAYPVAAELAGFGFRWLDASDPAAVTAWLDAPDEAWLDHNLSVAQRCFSLDGLDRALAGLLDDVAAGR